MYRLAMEKIKVEVDSENNIISAEDFVNESGIPMETDVTSSVSGESNCSTEVSPYVTSTEARAISDSKSSHGLGKNRSKKASVASLSKARMAANARERARTQSVNAGFSALRTLIPTEPADRKLSKIETLRLAVSYIAHLETVLLVSEIEEELVEQPCIRHAETLATVRDSAVLSPQPTLCTFCLSSKNVSLSFCVLTSSAHLDE